MSRLILRGVLFMAVLVTSWSVGGLVPMADAASERCSIIQADTVGGLDWSNLRAQRVCRAQTSAGVSGVTYVNRSQVVVSYNEASSSLRQVSKTTVHELTHLLEWRTTPKNRAELYSYIGVFGVTNYDAIETSDGTNLDEWKTNDRERLAESVVACQFGTNSFDGMNLVPLSRCGAFIASVQTALNAVGGV